MSIPFHVTNNFGPVTLTLEFDLLFENYNLANNFWTLSATALIFHMNISSGKTRLYQCFWPYDLYLESFTYFLKTLNLLITFEQRELELLYFRWAFPVAQDFFLATNIFYLVTLTLEFDLLFENFNPADIFWTVSAIALIFYMSIPWENTPWVPIILTLVTLTWDFDLLFWKL